MDQGVAILGADVPGSGGLSGVESLVSFQVRSLLCVPLTVFQKVRAAFTWTLQVLRARFDRDHLELVASIAGISAVALENARRLQWLEQENLRLAAEINLQHNMVGESSRDERGVPVSVASGARRNPRCWWVAKAEPERNWWRGPFIATARAPAGPLSPSIARPFRKGCWRASSSATNGARSPAPSVRRKGRLEMADGGVVFLDEIGELAPALQVKLLRVLQEREFERLGGSRPISVDIRLIAATNKDLAAAVKARTFREDLYYRLNVVSVVLPPLRERLEDIPVLAEYFVAKFAAKCKVKRQEDFSGSHGWPGELRLARQRART